MSNIYQKLVAANQDMSGYIKKDVEIRSFGGSYKGIGHDAVTAHVRPHLVKHGVVVIPSVEESSVTETKDNKGRILIRCIMTVHVTFVDADNPESSITVKTIGIGEDYGDKSAGKAYSYATKNALLKVLLLETGENDESRATEGATVSIGENGRNGGRPRLTPEQTKEDQITEAQIIDLIGLMKIKGREEAPMLQYINRIYNKEIKRIPDLTQGMYAKLKDVLGK